MSSKSISTASNGLVSSSIIATRQKRPSTDSNTEAGPSKRLRSAVDFDELYDDEATDNQDEGSSRGYLVVDVVARENEMSEEEWFRQVEVKARLEVFKLQLKGRAQSGPAIIKCVFYACWLGAIAFHPILHSKCRWNVSEDSLV